MTDCRVQAQVEAHRVRIAGAAGSSPAHPMASPGGATGPRARFRISRLGVRISPGALEGTTRSPMVERRRRRTTNAEVEGSTPSRGMNGEAAMTLCLVYNTTGEPVELIPT